MEKSLFVSLLGDYPLIRVLDFLLENRIYDYTKKDISNDANVAWSTLHTFWKDLEAFKVIVPTRTIGRATLFRLNMESPIVQHLIELDKKLTLDYSNTVAEKAIITA